MSTVLVIGGLGFVGLQAVVNPFENGYDISSVCRTAHGFRLADRPAVPDARLTRG